MPERRQSTDQIARAVALLRRFLAWWIGELAALVPGSLRRHFTPAAARLIVFITDEHAALRLENGGPAKPLGTFDLRSGDSPRLSVQTRLVRERAAAAVADGRIETCVRVPVEKALRTTIDLPLAAEGNLDEVISYELDRHTPFTAGQVYYASRVVAREATLQRLTVELLLVPRPLADDIIGAIRERLGLRAARLEITSAEGGQAVSGNLLPRTTAPRRKTASLTYSLAAAATCLAVTAIYLPLARMQRAAAAATEDFATVRAAAVLQHQIDELRKEKLFLIDRKREAPSVSELLLETTHVLPDDTFLSSWQLTGRDVQLGGTTKSAAALIPLLEQSRKFHDTACVTPVTQDPATGRESFYIAAKAAPEPSR